MLNFLGHKGNANQNYVEILPHSSENGCHQEHKSINVGEDAGKREPVYTVGGI
jgi:hypothetical protein